VVSIVLKNKMRIDGLFIGEIGVIFGSKELVVQGVSWLSMASQSELLMVVKGRQLCLNMVFVGVGYCRGVWVQIVWGLDRLYVSKGGEM
jgi:hypothetical protein